MPNDSKGGTRLNAGAALDLTYEKTLSLFREALLVADEPLETLTDHKSAFLHTDQHRFTLIYTVRINICVIR